MTVQELLARVDMARPGQGETMQKLAWLSELDGRLWADVLSHRSINEQSPSLPYSMDSFGLELMVKPPYDEIYVEYLAAKLDFSAGEYGRYSNGAAQFNATLDAWSCHMARTRAYTSNTRLTGVIV